MSEDLTNAPGLGAEELASRAARRAARLRENQATGLGADAAVEEQLRQAVRRQRTYSQGAEGERLVAQTLGFLERYGWVALHDVHWPGRPQANIDHIAVGPGGVVVIDAKNWTGDVAIRDGVLRQNGFSRARETTAAADATSAVTSRLAPQHRTATHALLCLVAQDVAATGVGRTTVVGRSALGEHLVGLPPRLSAYEVADVARALAADLAGDRSPAVLSSRDLEAVEGTPPVGLRQRSWAQQPSSPRTAGGRRPAARPSARSSPRPRPRGRTRRGAGSRLRTGLVKIAVLVAIVVYGPAIIGELAQSMGTALTSVLLPTPEPTSPTVLPTATEAPPAG